MNNYRVWLLLLGDLTVLALSFFATMFVRGHFTFQQQIITGALIPFAVISLICVIMLYAFDLYDFRFIRPVSSNLWRIGAVLIASPIISIVLFYTFNFFTVAPRATLVIFFASFGVLFVLWRRIFFKACSNSFKNKTVVWGTSPIAEQVFQEISHNPHRGYEPFLHVRELSQLIETVKKHNFDVLIIDDSLQLPNDLIEIIFSKKIITLSLTQTHEAILEKIPLEAVDETLFIQNIQFHRGVSFVLYRIFEYLVALPLLIITMPFCILVAIAIKIEDGGSIFYKHSRLGFLGKEFTLYKFRSMTVTSSDQYGQWAVKDDARITKVGKIIRKLHIDELPQMINILTGDIALVGPRPDAIAFGNELKNRIPHYNLRYLVKPGFTGWAQIKYHAAASEKDFAERLQYDLYYVKNRNFFMDIGILLRTVIIIFTHNV